MSKAIKVENLSKSYIIDHQKGDKDNTLRDLISSPLKYINFSKDKNGSSKEEFMALNNLSFEIERGDRVGIIGRNGAGKSTLLKVLSRITEPSKGRISIKGRVASLLEVGTGFHAELSGRENIYLNGAILGMTRSEIRKNFDEIVAFSEIEKFLDTPVKRYSSGMYVRLAFAVAAHLESEILIVDEVLAVGDAAFQKKCMGKMRDVGAEGRTILFVSHNIGQISSLCNEAILLDKGVIIAQNSTSKVIQQYYEGDNKEVTSEIIFENNSEKEVYIKSLRVLNTQNNSCNNFGHDESICIQTEINVNQHLKDVLLGIHVYDSLDKRIFTSELPVSELLKGEKSKKITMIIPPNILTPNGYKFNVGLHIPNIQLVDEHKAICPVSIYDNGSAFYKYRNLDYGCVFVKCDWVY